MVSKMPRHVPSHPHIKAQSQAYAAAPPSGITQGAKMDALIRLIQPKALGDGSHQLILPIYNTQVSVKVFPGSQNLDADALSACLQDVRDTAIDFEMKLSRTRPNSEVSRINVAHGLAVPVSPETLELIGLAKNYSAESGGVFDVTMGSVTPLWNFHTQQLPDKDALARALTHVDWNCIQVHAATGAVSLSDPEARLDLGGVAKGFIADKLAALIRRHGCDCAFVNLGGNVLTVGRRPDGTPWRIGVRDPKKPDTIIGVVPAVSQSVVTSGLYERCFVKNGTFYHHILDTKTGMPVSTDVASATIVSDTSIDGDGFSTTLFALGVKAAMDFVDAHPRLEAVIVDSGNAMHVSRGLAGKVDFVEQHRS